MKKLSDAAQAMLSTCCSQSWYVSENNLPVVAELVVRGYIEGRGGDIETVGVMATARGLAAAKRLKLIEASDPDDYFYRTGYKKTETAYAIGRGVESAIN